MCFALHVSKPRAGLWVWDAAVGLARSVPRGVRHRCSQPEAILSRLVGTGHCVALAYTPKANTRNRVPGTVCAENAVSCI